MQLILLDCIHIWLCTLQVFKSLRFGSSDIRVSIKQENYASNDSSGTCHCMPQWYLTEEEEEQAFVHGQFRFKSFVLHLWVCHRGCQSCHFSLQSDIMWMQLVVADTVGYLWLAWWLTLGWWDCHFGSCAHASSLSSIGSPISTIRKGSDNCCGEDVTFDVLKLQKPFVVPIQRF